MSDYNPTTYLVRVLFRGKTGMGMTMDTTGNDVMQQTVAAMVESVGNVFMKAYEINPPAGDIKYFEVLLGATANELSRREDLLNDARNMLIDLESINLESVLKAHKRKPLADLIDEIGEEIGVVA